MQKTLAPKCLCGNFIRPLCDECKEAMRESEPKIQARIYKREREAREAVLIKTAIVAVLKNLTEAVNGVDLI